MDGTTVNLKKEHDDKLSKHLKWKGEGKHYFCSARKTTTLFNT